MQPAALLIECLKPQEYALLGSIIVSWIEEGDMVVCVARILCLYHRFVEGALKCRWSDYKGGRGRGRVVHRGASCWRKEGLFEECRDVVESRNGFAASSGGRGLWLWKWKWLRSIQVKRVCVDSAIGTVTTFRVGTRTSNLNKHLNLIIYQLQRNKYRNYRGAT
jgi:hypothetical protein